MTPEQRLNAANEINQLWVRHIRYGETPPDLSQVSKILEWYEVSVFQKSPLNKCVMRLKIVDPSRA